MSWDKERIAQLRLPDPADDDPHPRLLLEGYGIHAGQGFTALFPDGWHEITLEVAWEPTGPACWYISTPGFEVFFVKHFSLKKASEFPVFSKGFSLL